MFNASIGLAPNRYLAKLASEFAKPAGIFALSAQDIAKPVCKRWT